MIHCEKCGKEINMVNVNCFLYDGSDDWFQIELEEHINGAYVDLQTNWCGYEFDEDSEEVRDCIRCPYCGEYPFKCEEIQKYTVERVVMFTTGDNDEQ